MITGKRNILVGVCGVLLAAATVVTAQVPQMIHYQGKVSTLAGTPFSGPGQFKFALVDAAGAWLWSNDGAWIVPPGGGTPTPGLAVPITVNNGIYSVLLGNITLPGMTFAIPPSTFASTVVYLRVWFSDGGPFVQMTPDIRIASVGYAMIAHTVVDGTITEPKLANGAVTASKLANDAITSSAITNGSVTSDKLASGAVTGSKLANEITLGSILSGAGVLELSSGFSPGPHDSTPIKLDGSAGSVSAAEALLLSKTLPTGPSSSVTTTQAVLSAEASGGLLRIYDEEQKESVRLGAETTSGGGHLKLYTEDSETGVEVWGDVGGGGVIRVNKADSSAGVYIRGDWDGAGYLRVHDTNGTGVIILDAHDADGNGRVTTQVLEITGGSDLSETFDVTGQTDTPQPGMIVSINPNRPGQLVVSSTAYDRTVAGIMSGAGGINPGMLMGQHGTPASGKYPVALTGRVYCRADASNGAIQAGDLLTTSDLPGHAMKVTDHARAQGAIIGKAMSSLDEGAGLVLVLVSLQ